MSLLVCLKQQQLLINLSKKFDRIIGWIWVEEKKNYVVTTDFKSIMVCKYFGLEESFKIPILAMFSLKLANMWQKNFKCVKISNIFVLSQWIWFAKMHNLA
jgi:hypothetical protein